MDDIAPIDASSLLDAVGQLKKESIASAGRRLAEPLWDRTYLDLCPVEFFRKCYAVRSKLVHGILKRPDPEVIRSLIGPLLWFVRDLIRLGAGIDWPHPREVS